MTRREDGPWQPPAAVRARSSPAITALIRPSTLSPPWLAVLTGAAGLLVVSTAFALSRAGMGWALAPFWIGLVAIFAVPAWRLLGDGAGRVERSMLLVWLALALYAVKLLHSPISLDLYDELQHWRTVSDIASTGHLFNPNPLLQTSAVFPAMEIVTVAFMQLSGSAPDAAGIVVIAAARVLLILSLFLIFERIGRSSRVAGVATLVYLTNPSLLFFDAQFAYESMAIGLAAFVILLLVIRAEPDAQLRVGLTLLATASLAALVVTHHLTSYVLVGLLILWALVGLLGRGYVARMGPGGMATIFVVMVVGWLAFAATVTVGYLVAPVGGAVSSFVRLVLREEEGRALFQAATSAGIVSPAWERMLGFAAALIAIVLLPIGAAFFIRQASMRRDKWRARFSRLDPLAVTLVLLSAAFPATLALRFTSRGAELASRASAALFVAVSFTAAIALVGLIGRPAIRTRRWVALAAMVVLLMGNVVVGWPPWQRLPGPFLVGADSRSINAESTLAAAWARDVLGPGQRFGADRTNTLLLGSHGGQWIVWYQSAQVDLSPLWFSASLGEAELNLIREASVEFLVVDHRLTEQLPQTGIYFDASEVRDGPHDEPIAPELLDKFDNAPGISRIFDSGQIQIYDLRGLLGNG